MMTEPRRPIPGWVLALCLVVVVVVGALVAEGYAADGSKTGRRTIGMADELPQDATAYFCAVYARAVRADPDATPERLAALVAAGKRDGSSDSIAVMYALIRSKPPAKLTATLGPFVDSLRAKATDPPRAKLAARAAGLQAAIRSTCPGR